MFYKAKPTLLLTFFGANVYTDDGSGDFPLSATLVNPVSADFESYLANAFSARPKNSSGEVLLKNVYKNFFFTYP